MSIKYIIGIDEVGRGALAGPVMVSAVAIPVKLRLRALYGIPLKDSKKLTAKYREAWAEYVRSHPHIRFAISRVSPRVVDRINISRAANRAALRACEKLLLREGIPPRRCRIYLDGGLFLGDKSHHGLPARTIVKADEKFASVKLASIVAKVSRDNYMVKLAKRHPAYGFELHKGYGTKMHMVAVRKHGPSPMHRLTFLD